MGNTTFLVGKMPDKTILDIFENIQEKYGLKQRSFQYSGLIFTEEELSIISKKIENTYIFTEAHIETNLNGFKIHIQRNNNDPERIHYDTITIAHRQNPTPETIDFVEFSNFVCEKMQFPKPGRPIEYDKSARGLIEQEIASLKSLHDKMIADALELRKTLEEQDALRKTNFELAAQKRELEIVEAEKSSLQRIAEEKTELNEKLKEFDLSDHSRARRKLREDISSQVQEILKRPVGSGISSIKLVVIVVICIMASTLAGRFAYETLASFVDSVKLVQNGNQLISSPMLWMLAIRGVILTAVSLGFVAYLVSMLRRSYDEEIHVQRQLQRYGMDINRASWVIETAMEMTTKEGATLPERWVEGATYGLFATGQKAQDPNAITALGAIMGLGPEVSVGPGGANIKLSSKGTKQASKEG
ncbi:hypothetical protein [Agrobacterium vitis]|uniref:hypothetical protein n=1 Tax=Agrobacterium vitis TaxID=373 RepID=UPI0012E749ED|nr:hypothetical protein [Agrobacterium vitis]MUZ65322.1 hypothetical protein [Agrobacterium vitis]